MIILPVDIAGPVEGHSSSEAAIAAAKAHPQQWKTREYGALLAGQTFVGGRASFTRWCLEFTGSFWIDIRIQNDEVHWQLTRDPPAFQQVSAPYALRWPSGDECVTDPVNILATRVGAPFWQLWADDAGFYVYLHQKLILCFHSVRRIDDGTCILSVFEDD
jgi:hypothetical protein